jgi:hypothetical protein
MSTPRIAMRRRYVARVDVATARAVLGVGPGATADELRAAYRDRLRAAHPDLQGRDAGTAEVVAAYRLLREPDAEPAPAEEPPVAVVVDGDTVTADLPAGDLFALLLEAGHALGEVSYVDAQAGLLEVVVEVEGHGACSVLLTLQGRAAGHTEAWCTVEPLAGGPAPPAETVAALLADGLRSIAGR